MSAIAGAPPAPSPVAAAPRAFEQHLSVGVAQLAAGVGNLAFVLVSARVLPPESFAAVAAFVAVHTLVHLPGFALGAGAAIDPARAQRMARRSLFVTIPAALAIAVEVPEASVPVAPT